MKPCPLKPAATQSRGRFPEDRLVVGRDVVVALDEEGSETNWSAGSSVSTHVARGAASLAGVAGVAGGGEIAGEHAAVGELLGGEVELRRDDERLEQPLADRLAQEEVARLALDRQLREPGGLPAGRRRRIRRSSSSRPRRRAPSPRGFRSARRRRRGPRRRAPRAPRAPPAAGRGSRPLRTTRLPPARTRRGRARAAPPRPARRSARGRRARSAADVRRQLRPRLGRVGEEQVAARLKARVDAHSQPLLRHTVEGERLAG